MSRERPETIERLRELDRVLARGVSARSRDAVRRELRRRARERPFHVRLRWWPAVAFVAGAVTMALLVLRASEPSPSPAPTEPVAVASESPSAARRAPAEVETAGSSATLSEPPCAEPEPGSLRIEVDRCARVDGVRLGALSRARLEWHEGSITLHEGQVLFDVPPRPERPLYVSAGEVEVEVVGTRFVVRRDGERGSISMLEGHVRVRIGGEPAIELRDEQHLEWPSASAEPPAARRPRARSRRAPPAAEAERDEGLAALLDEVAALRRRGSYREAVERLRSELRPQWSRRGRELVSFEIGTLLERQLGDVAGACEHWRAHQRRFPGGRYHEILERRLERLCGE